jgi:hypothetical protein
MRLPANSSGNTKTKNGSCYKNTFITHHHHQHHNDDNDHEEKEEKKKNLNTPNGAFLRAEQLFLLEDESTSWRAMTMRLSPPLGTATAATSEVSSSWSAWTSFGTMTSAGDAGAGGADHQLSQLRRLFDHKRPKLPSI